MMIHLSAASPFLTFTGAFIPHKPENGNVYSWGAGMEGQLGHGKADIFLAKPTKISRDFLPFSISQICAGSFISLALSGDLSPLFPYPLKARHYSFRGMLSCTLIFLEVKSIYFDSVTRASFIFNRLTSSHSKLCIDIQLVCKLL